MEKLSIIGKSIIMTATLMGATALFTTSVQADTIQGKLNGLECASHGEQCPTDKLDPHIALERDFVVQTGDGRYYFITNVDRAVKARHALATVRVEGDVSSRFDAVNAKELWVKNGGNFKLAWSLAMEDEQRKIARGMGPDPSLDK